MAIGVRIAPYELTFDYWSNFIFQKGSLKEADEQWTELGDSALPTLGLEMEHGKGWPHSWRNLF